jgi:hypothetical protein
MKTSKAIGEEITVHRRLDHGHFKNKPRMACPSPI